MSDYIPISIIVADREGNITKTFGRDEDKPIRLTPQQINYIVDAIPHVDSADETVSKISRAGLQENLKSQLRLLQLCPRPELIERLRADIVKYYKSTRIRTGGAPGIDSSEAFGSGMTQMTLDSFRTMDETNEAIGHGVKGMQRLMYAVLKTDKSAFIHFNIPVNERDVIDMIPALVETNVKDFIEYEQVLPFAQDYQGEDSNFIAPPYWWHQMYTYVTGVPIPDSAYIMRIHLNRTAMYKHRINIAKIAKAIEKEKISKSSNKEKTKLLTAVYSSQEEGIIDLFPHEDILKDIFTSSGDPGRTMEQANPKTPVLQGSNTPFEQPFVSKAFLSTVVREGLKVTKVSGINGIKEIKPMLVPIIQLCGKPSKLNDLEVEYLGATEEYIRSKGTSGSISGTSDMLQHNYVSNEDPNMKKRLWALPINRREEVQRGLSINTFRTLANMSGLIELGAETNERGSIKKIYYYVPSDQTPVEFVREFATFTGVTGVVQRKNSKYPNTGPQLLSEYGLQVYKLSLPTDSAGNAVGKIWTIKMKRTARARKEFEIKRFRYFAGLAGLQEAVIAEDSERKLIVGYYSPTSADPVQVVDNYMKDYKIQHDEITRLYEYVYAISTGSNLIDLYKIPWINTQKTISNDMHEIAAVLGIESAKAYTVGALVNVLESSNISINSRHIDLITDFMFNMGTPLGVTYSGISRQKKSAISTSTVERSMEQIYRGAVYSNIESVRNMGSSIVTGTLPCVGSGSYLIFPTMEDVEKLKEKMRKEADLKKVRKLQNYNEPLALGYSISASSMAVVMNSGKRVSQRVCSAESAETTWDDNIGIASIHSRVPVAQPAPPVMATVIVNGDSDLASKIEDSSKNTRTATPSAEDVRRNAIIAPPALIDAASMIVNSGVRITATTYTGEFRVNISGASGVEDNLSISDIKVTTQFPGLPDAVRQMINNQLPSVVADDASIPIPQVEETGEEEAMEELEEEKDPNSSQLSIQLKSLFPQPTGGTSMVNHNTVGINTLMSKLSVAPSPSPTATPTQQTSTPSRGRGRAAPNVSLGGRARGRGGLSARGVSSR